MSFDLQSGLTHVLTASRLDDVFALVCGQNPEHTWAPGGLMLPCCERCLGLYAGAALALLLHLWLRPKLTGRFLEWHGLFLLLMVPLGFHWIEQGAVLRTISGVLFGAGVTTFLWLPLAERVLRIPRCVPLPERGHSCPQQPTHVQQARATPFIGIARSVLECCGTTKWRRSFRNAALSPNDHACHSGYAIGIFFSAILVPILASDGGRPAALLLTALAAAGLSSLAVLAVANLLLAIQLSARSLRRLRVSQTARTP